MLCLFFAIVLCILLVRPWVRSVLYTRKKKKEKIPLIVIFSYNYAENKKINRGIIFTQRRFQSKLMGCFRSFSFFYFFFIQMLPKIHK